MARPPEQAINEAIAALGHFELVELGAAVNDLREELEMECALTDRLAALAFEKPDRSTPIHEYSMELEAVARLYRERRNA